MIFHVIDAASWEGARREGAVRPASLAAQGFVHLCTAAQLEGVIARFFARREGLLALHVDEARLPNGALRWEAVPDAPGAFPHLYAPLPLAAVARVEPIGA